MSSSSSILGKRGPSPRGINHRTSRDLSVDSQNRRPASSLQEQSKEEIVKHHGTFSNTVGQVIEELYKVQNLEARKEKLEQLLTELQSVIGQLNEEERSDSHQPILREQIKASRIHLQNVVVWRVCNEINLIEQKFRLNELKSEVKQQNEGIQKAMGALSASLEGIERERDPAWLDPVAVTARCVLDEQQKTVRLINNTVRDISSTITRLQFLASSM